MPRSFEEIEAEAEKYANAIVGNRPTTDETILAIAVFFLTAAVPSLALTFARMPSADTALTVTGFICAFVAYFSVRRKAARWRAAYCAKLIELINT